MSIDLKLLRQLRTLSIVEGCSTLVLFFIAMPLKYLAGVPLAVKIVGSIHGALFTLLALTFAYGWKNIPLPTRTVALGLAAAVIPFGPFLMERRLARLADTQGDVR